MRKLFMPAGLALTLLLSAFPLQAQTLNITDAWIKNLPPVVPMRAGYLTIENNSRSAVSIVKLESEVFTEVDIHETIEKNGMMSMQPLPTLTIDANSSKQLAPGGIHLMMMQPQVSLEPGDLVTLKLQYGDGTTQTIQMTVRK